MQFPAPAGHLGGLSLSSQTPGAGQDALPAARRDAWSRYWARGVAHSCAGTYGELYGGAIATFWGGVFGSLPPVARVLDVATGNGVLPRMLLERCRSPGVQCDAVDIAPIQPQWLTGIAPADRERVRVLGGVDAEALPFADGTFDLVVSQYGIEYARLDRAMGEALRVLVPGGRVAVVLHHAQGRPATLAAIEIEHLAWLAREGGLLDATAGMLEPMARAATEQGRVSLKGDARANAAREQFNARQNELAARGDGKDGADVLFEARDAAMSILAIAGRQGLPAAVSALDSYRAELTASETRLRDLREHALDAQAAQALRDRLAAALQVPVSLEEIREGTGYLMGWAVRTGTAA
jgi:SAM-dependent methyltransferase